MVESTCLKREWLRAWLDGELDEAVQAHVATHVRTCAVCGRVADEISNEGAPIPGGSPTGGTEQTAATPDSGNVDPNEEGVDHDSDPHSEVTTVFCFDHSRKPCAEPSDACCVDRRFGRFELKQRVGVGGFGIVYRAFDTTLQRDVALKLPRNLSFVDEQVKSAFLREARAAAALRHPHIVPIFDAGEIDGQCYLTAAYCPGETLAVWRKRCGGKVLPRTAAAIAQQLAGALAHAHQAGILHQDVKPENVLLDAQHPAEGLPFTLLLTDFGLAKLMNGPDSQAQNNVALGTARYMAPEQAARTGTPLGPAADVYSLGVILYELLTGRAPIQGADDLDTLSRLAVDLPPSPERFVADLPRDLGAICLKCLEKDPAGRYASARDLEADLQRFLEGQSTLARPHRTPERAWRTMRRYPAATALVVTLVLSLTGFVVGLALHAAELRRHSRQLEALTERQAELLQQANEATSLASRREDEVAELLYASDMRLGGRALREGDARVLHERLVGQLPGATGVDRRDFAWHFLAGFDRPPQAEARVSELPLYSAVISPDGRQLAVGGHDGAVRIFDTETLRELVSFDSGQREVNGLDFAHDGKRLASAGQDGSVCVWELPDGRRLQRIAAHPEQAYQCVFADDDRLLVTCGQRDPQVRLWDAANGQTAGALSGHERDVEYITLAPNGTTLASAGTDGTARLWDVASRSLLQTLRKHDDRLTSACFTQQGRVLVTGGLDCRICIWNAENGKLLCHRALYDPIQSLAAAADGAWILAGDRGGALTMLCAGPEGWLQDPAVLPDSVPPSRDLSAVVLYDDQPAVGPDPDPPPLLALDVRAWPAHQGRIYTLARDTSGAFFSAGEDGCVRQWSTDARSPVVEWPPARGAEITGIADLPGSEGLLALDINGKVHLLRGPADNLAAVPVHLAGVELLRACSSCDGHPLIAIAADGHVCRWLWPDSETLDLGTLRTQSRPSDLAVSPDGTEFVTIDFGHNLILWLDARTGQELASLKTRDPRSVAWSPDGSQIIVAALDDVLLIDARERQLVHKIATHRGPANCVAIHPRGRLVASGGSDRSVILTDTGNRQSAMLRGHRTIVTAAAFSRDGRCLATGDDNGTIKLWHTATRQYLYDLAVDRGPCSRLVFSADGRRLAALVAGKVLLFDALPSSSVIRDQ